MKITNDIPSHIIGGLYGVAIGDALGAPFEFRNSTPKIKYTGILSDETVTVNFQYYKMIILPGSVTDDTEMTIQLLSSILENARSLSDKSVKFQYIEDDAIKKYLDWVNLKNTPLGKNTRKLMKGVTTVSGFRKRQLKFDTSEVESNGTLMRCFPFVLLPKNEWKKMCIRDCNLTNNNDVNRECSVIYLSIARWLIYGEKLNCSGKDSELKITQKTIRKAIQQALDNEIVDVSINKGWVVHALYVAVITLLNSKSFENGMDFIAKHFIKGDTDTLMAIAGGLLGAMFGFENMANEKKTGTNIDKVNYYFENVAKGRPKFTKEMMNKLLNIG